MDIDLSGSINLNDLDIDPCLANAFEEALSKGLVRFTIYENDEKSSLHASEDSLGHHTS